MNAGDLMALVNARMLQMKSVGSRRIYCPIPLKVTDSDTQVTADENLLGKRRLVTSRISFLPLHSISQEAISNPHTTTNKDNGRL